jgi:4-carboxymuconolactone decarboxylase
MAERPNDIDPQSGFRLPLPKRDELDEDGKKLYDEIVNPKAGTIRGLRGPAGIRLYSPQNSKISQPINRYLRFEAGLGGRLREMAILATARECDSRFEWAAHEPEALKEGVPQATIDIIKYRRATDGLREEDKVLIDLGRQMFGARKVAPETFARALKLFGPKKLVDIVCLMGNYAATAAMLTAFDMQLDPGETHLLPMD